MLRLKMLALLALTAFPVVTFASNLPRSQQATIVETVSPTEVRVRATGIGHWQKGDDVGKKDIDNYLLETAQVDARAAAVWYITLGGSDPILTTAKEKSDFEMAQDEFFSPGTVQGFLSWEGDEILSRVKSEIRKKVEYGLTIQKAFTVNKAAIETWLTGRGVLASMNDVTESIGLPTMLVTPVAGPGQSAVTLLQSDPNLAIAARAIEAFLTNRRFEVISLEQETSLNELASAQSMLQGVTDDPSYTLAMSVGADVYLSYSVSLESAQFNTRKATVAVSAFESTTARLLGSETGYSPAATASEKSLIEAAINDATEKVVARVIAYWKEDVQRGVQYKLIANLEGLTPAKTEDVQLAMLEALGSVSKNGKFKENTATTGRLDYIIWCDPAVYGQPTRLYLTIKREIENKIAGVKVSQVSLNRKLVIIQLGI